MSRASRQRVVTLALAILDDAAYKSRTHRVDTTEVRLAFAVLWFFVNDHKWLRAYWTKAQGPNRLEPLESCREPYYGVAKALRDAGWDAPVDAGSTT